MSGRRAKWCHKQALKLIEENPDKKVRFIRVLKQVKRLWKQAPRPIRKKLVLLHRRKAAAA